MVKDKEFEDDEDQEDDDEEFDLEEDDDEDEVPKKTVRKGRPPAMQKQRPVPKKKQERFVRHRQEAFDGVYDNETEQLMSYEESTIAILNQLNEVLVRFGE